MPEVSRRKRKALRTREHLASVAFELFERDGFADVTMEQIATQADVARGTLYNHFPVKEAVLACAMDAQLEHDLETLMARVMSCRDFTRRAATLLQASDAWWTSHRAYLAPYVRFRFQQVEGHADDAASDMAAAWEGLIAHAQQQGELRADMPASQLAQYLHFLYLSVLMRWLADASLDLDDAMADMLTFFMDGAVAMDAAGI